MDNNYNENQFENTNATVNEPQNEVSQNNSKNNKTLLYVLFGVILVLVIVIIVMFLNNNKNNAGSIDNGNTNNLNNQNNVQENTVNQNVDQNTSNQNANQNTESTNTNNNNEVLSSNDILQATVNNVRIKFPATKDSFNGTGWAWDERYATKKLDTGYTSSGGRIGSFPGGVVVGVVNLSGEVKEIQDCVIDDGTFYNPKDGSNNVVFVGGITFSSTIEEVKTKMSELKYSNVKETIIDATSKYKYYKDDNQNNYKDYIEFTFNNGTLTDVGIFTSGQ